MTTYRTDVDLLNEMERAYLPVDDDQSDEGDIHIDLDAEWESSDFEGDEYPQPESSEPSRRQRVGQRLHRAQKPSVAVAFLLLQTALMVLFLRQPVDISAIPVVAMMLFWPLIVGGIFQDGKEWREIKRLAYVMLAISAMIVQGTMLVAFFKTVTVDDFSSQVSYLFFLFFLCTVAVVVFLMSISLLIHARPTFRNKHASRPH